MANGTSLVCFGFTVKDPERGWKSNPYPAKSPEMEILNSIFFVELSGHKLKSYQSFCLVFYPHFPFYKMLFINRLEFSCFPVSAFLKPE
jgi:hypothetical protein